MRELSSQRLRLRRWRAEDAAFLLDLESRTETMRYLGEGTGLMTHLDEATASIRRRRALDAPGYGIWAVTELSGTLVGNLLCKPLAAGAAPVAAAEIGWHLHPDFQGLGYATEAAAAAIDYAERSGVQRLEAIVDARNLPSLRVCARLGFRQAASWEDAGGSVRLGMHLDLPR